MQPYPNAPTATHSKPLNLVDVGPTPGVLDPTQKARVLRSPNSTLHFSAFDPLTASGQDVNLEFRKLNIQEDKYPPKRIVLEVSPNGQSSWRFVPRARKEEGVDDEGVWPRVIDLCGQLAYCSQDQWDIYKLDSFYECVVHPIPALSTIRVKDENAPPQGRRAPTPAGKRVFESDDTLEHIPKKRAHLDVTMESVRDTSEDEHGDDEDEDEALVAEMITDERQYRNPKSPVATRRVRLKTPAKTRKAHPTPRAMRKKPVSQSAGPSNPIIYPQGRQSHSVPPESSKKRKEAYESMFDAIQEGDEIELSYSPRKRANIEPSSAERRAPSVPSGAGQRELRAKRREREEQKRKRWEEEQKARIRQREAQLMQDIMNGVPPLQQFQPHPPSGYYHPEIDRDSSMRGFSDFEDGSSKPGPTSTAFSSSEDAARAAELEESRRKMAQLEADRPIWEKAAHERRAREEAEEAAARAKAEAKKRQEEERVRHERERFRQEQREAETQRRREEARKEAERVERARERQAKKERWTSGRWTTARAIERFREVSKTFSETQFSKDNPLAIDDVPWPTLQRPDELSLPEDVDWDSVEHFFEVLKNHMKTQDYITLVEKNSRAFHPDRWRSRGLFKAIVDPEERNWMEIAATTVSQALTPIWQKVRVMKQA